MRTLSSLLALSLVTGMAAATPALSHEGDDPFPLILSAPGPRSMLDTVLMQLRTHDVAGATAKIEATENLLIDESLSDHLPAQQDPVALRDAVPVLDEALQALSRGDVPAAEQAVSHARSMI